MNERISVQSMNHIWCEALDTFAVSPGDNFFELGGHSLIAAKIILNVERVCGVRLRLTDVYDHPTPRDLTVHINTH